MCAFSLWLPNYDEGICQVIDAEQIPFHAPQINRIISKKDCDLEFKMSVPVLHPSKFKTYGADVIAELKVNGQNVQPFTRRERHADILIADFGSSLHAGKNSIQNLSRSSLTWVCFYLIPALEDPVDMALLTAATGVLLIFALKISKLLPGGKFTVFETAVFLCGTVLRLCYSWTTAFWDRANDTYSGHIPYIEYLMTNWKLPTSFSETIEYYQPPAYYFLLAIEGILPKYFGACHNSLLAVWQAQSSILSIIALMCSFIISRMLFERRQVWQQAYFLIYMAVFPASVYFSGTINNDSMFNLIAVAWLAVMISIEKQITLNKWLLLTLLLCIGMLTKGTTIPLVFISILMLAASPQIDSVRKLALTVITAGSLLLSAGWFYLPNAIHAKSAAHGIVANLDRIASNTRINENASTLTTFDPLAIVACPFSSQGDFDWRNQYFWEFLFRSAFFGESYFWDDNPRINNARVIATSALLLLPFVFLGLIRIKTRGPGQLMVVTLLVELFSHLAFVMQAPYICCQAFRYSAITVVPMTYFCIQGIANSPRPFKIFAMLVLTILWSACAYFEISLF